MWADTRGKGRTIASAVVACAVALLAAAAAPAHASVTSTREQQTVTDLGFVRLAPGSLLSRPSWREIDLVETELAPVRVAQDVKWVYGRKPRFKSDKQGTQDDSKPSGQSAGQQGKQGKSQGGGGPQGQGSPSQKTTQSRQAKGSKDPVWAGGRTIRFPSN